MLGSQRGNFNISHPRQSNGQKNQVNALDSSNQTEGVVNFENFSEAILNEERSIVKENLDRLKVLLSEKKQINRRNRLDLSPQPVSKATSSIVEKENNFQSSKGYSSYRMNENSSIIERSRVFDSGQIMNKNNQYLISDIKQKIKGSVSPYRQGLSPQKSNIIRSISRQPMMIKPSPVYFYQNNQIRTDKQINFLVRKNQQLQNVIDEKNIQIKSKQKKISSLEMKISEIVKLFHEKQAKYHEVLQQKNEEIQNLKNNLQNQQFEVKQICENFESIYKDGVEYFLRKFNIRTNNLERRLQDLNNVVFPKAMKKIKVEKLIFQNEQIYRKTKNKLEMSPSIKGDTFEELEQKRHEQEKQLFDRQIQYQKNRYKKTIDQYEKRYQEIYNSLIESQKKNNQLKKQIIALKGQQNRIISDLQIKQSKYQQKKKQLEQLSQQQQSRISKQQQTIKQLQYNILKEEEQKTRILVELKTVKQEQERLRKQNQMYSKRPSYFKKQILPGKQTQQCSTPIQKKNVQTYSIASQAALDGKKSFNLPYLNFSEINDEKIVIGSPNINSETKKYIKQRQDQIFKKELEEKRKQEEQKKIQQLKRRIELELQEKKRQKEKELLKQTYFQELQHIRTMLKTVQQSSLKVQRDQNTQKQKQDSSEVQNKQTMEKKSKNMKQLLKVQVLAKKQRKEKEIAKMKLETLQRELDYQKQKNQKLQGIISESQNKIFSQVKQLFLKQNYEDSLIQNGQQSFIEEEQIPFDHMLRPLTSSRQKKCRKSEEVNVNSAVWHSQVKSRLGYAVQRLQTLENKFNLNENSLVQNKEERMFSQQQFNSDH